MRKVFLYTNLLFICTWIFIFTFLSFTTHSELVHLINRVLSRDSQSEVLSSVLDPEVYFRLKYISLVLAILQGAFFVIVFKRPLVLEKLNAALFIITEYPKWILSCFAKLGKNEKIFFLLFILSVILHRLFLGYQTGVIYDEAWTYLAFTSKNILVGACFYPTSNNHILFSHLSQITKFLPFNILLNLRLAAIIPCILAIVTLFFCLKKMGYPAWMGMVLFSFSFPVVYYGFVARGYMLMVLFFIVGFFSLLQILREPLNDKPWYRLSISSALGFYTIPVYLYPFISLFGFAGLYFLFTSNRNSFFRILKYAVLTVCLTFLLYLPVLAISGVQSVIGNKYIQPLPFREVLAGLKDHFMDSLHFLAGSSNLYILSLCLIIPTVAVIATLRFKKNLPVVFSLFCLVLVPAFILIHRILPVERTWIYLMVPLILLITSFFNKTTRRIPATLLILVYLIFINIRWNSQMLWYDRTCEEDYLQGKYFSEYFHNKKARIITSSRISSYLKFNRLLRNENWEIETETIEPLTGSTYYIHYLNSDKQEYLPEGLKKIAVYRNYEMFVLSTP